MGNLFQKLGFVEAKDEYGYNPPTSDLNLEEESDGQELVDAEIPEQTDNLDTLIQDIYKANGIDSKESSIFKVSDYLATLPKEMATNTKRNTVVGILNASGLNVAIVMDDAHNRYDILCAVQDQMEKEQNSIIQAARNRIEDLMNEVEGQNSTIYDAEQKLDRIVHSIREELGNIQSLMDFIDPDKEVEKCH